MLVPVFPITGNRRPKVADNKTRRSALAQGIYGIVIGLICLVFIPLGLPLSVIAMVPATLALGFGAALIRDAILWDETHEQ